MHDPHKSEAELARELERLRTLFDHAADPIFIVDRETHHFLDCNAPAMERYGYSADELRAMTVYELHPPDEHDLVRVNISSEEGDSPHSYTHLTRDGVRLAVEVHTKEIEYDGRPAWLSIVRDVSDRRRAEEALRESEERYRNLVELAPETIFVVQDERIVLINSAGAELLGAERADELIGRTLDEFVHPGHRALARQRIGRVLQEGRVPRVESRFVRLDGSVIDVEVAGRRVRFEGADAVQVVARDITERMHTEEKLRVEKAHFERLFESAPQAIVLVSNDGRIQRVNTGFLELFGYERDELLGQPVDETIVPDELRDEGRAATEAVARGETIRLESRRRRKDGTLVEVAILGAPIETEGGQVAVYGIYTDITERLRLERRLRQAHKMEAIGQLAGGIAHDFNNLLTVILGNCEVLQGDLAEDDPLRRDLEEIKRAGERAAALTRQLLAFSRRQMLQPKLLDLNVVVEETNAMLRRLIGENIELVTDLARELGRVRADPGQLEQVIVNLAVNARDAMPDGGRLTIATANRELDEAFAQTHHPLRPGAYVVLSVADTGVGMDVEARSHIFEPFFTTKAKGKGTGLGLSTVYGIVKQSDGYIWVESEPGQGTTFEIFLPRAVGAGAAARRERAADRESGGSETVLIVEDEDVVRDLVQRALVRRGYRVMTVSDPEHALRVSREYTGPIQLMVTDVVMPGLGGRELSERLTPERPAMKVLYISGYTELPLDEERLGPGRAFLQKPFTPEKLARAVRDLLDG